MEKLNKRISIFTGIHVFLSLLCIFGILQFYIKTDTTGEGPIFSLAQEATDAMFSFFIQGIVFIIVLGINGLISVLFTIILLVNAIMDKKFTLHTIINIAILVILFILPFFIFKDV